MLSHRVGCTYSTLVENFSKVTVSIYTPAALVRTAHTSSLPALGLSLLIFTMQ